MFGQNEITKAFPDARGDLLVNSLWYTIQGEGPDAGRPAIFVRLSKCNLACWFCDTEFEKGILQTVTMIRDAVLRVSRERNCNFVVLTGGEPLLQNIVPLVVSLNSRGISVSVETAGTVYAEGLERVFASDRSINDNLIVCSPKTPKLNKKVIPLIGALKYIVKVGEMDEDGLPTMSTQKPGELARLYRPCELLSPKVPIYLQPMDEGSEKPTRDNLTYAALLSMRHQYRLSVQVHKMVGLE